MDKLILSIAAAILLFAPPGLAQEPASTALDQETREFVRKAQSSNNFELKSSRVATKKAQRPDVKAFAEKMIEDHTKVERDLRATLDKIGVELPVKEEPRYLDEMKRLETIANDKFDGAYVTSQAKTHDEAIALFEGYAKQGSNAELKTLAEKTLPTLKQHAEAVAKLREEVVGSAAD